MLIGLILSLGVDRAVPERSKRSIRFCILGFTVFRDSRAELRRTGVPQRRDCQSLMPDSLLSPVALVRQSQRETFLNLTQPLLYTLCLKPRFDRESEQKQAQANSRSRAAEQFF